MTRWISIAFLLAQILCFQYVAGSPSQLSKEEVYQKMSRPVLGSKEITIKRFASVIQSALDIRFEQKDSYYKGGIYYKFVNHEGLTLMIYSNYNEYSKDYRLDHEQELEVLLYMGGGTAEGQHAILIQLEKAVGSNFKFLVP